MKKTNTEAAQNTEFYQILKQENRRNTILHQKLVKDFKADPHNRKLQSDLQLSKLYESAYLTLLNKCKEKKLSHTPRNLTLLCDMLSFVDQIEERINQYLMEEEEITFEEVLVAV